MLNAYICQKFFWSAEDTKLMKIPAPCENNILGEEDNQYYK